METPETLVVIGGSAGAFEEMRTLLLRLPADLPAVVILCLHTRSRESPRLAEVLGLRAPLPVATVEDGMPIERSHAYVAPPNHHVFVRQQRLWLSTGPTESYSRPSIDVLFRSAAVAGRERCTGVVLSGLNDDGALGLRAIARCGGATFVQDPETARYDRMPRAALLLVPEAEVRETWSLAERIVERARSAPAASASACPEPIELEDRIAFQAGRSAASWMEMPAEAVSSCPECGGPVADLGEHYRCLMGHAYSERSFMTAHRREIVRALWAAQRLLQERVRILERLEGAEARATEYKEHAEALHQLLVAVVQTGDAEALSAEPEGQGEAR
jgi:two-component system chemotaxis response regulator CheB